MLVKLTIRSDVMTEIFQMFKQKKLTKWPSGYILNFLAFRFLFFTIQILTQGTLNEA